MPNILQTIEAILQECAKRGMKPDVHISVHRFAHDKKTPTEADGHEFVDHLLSQFDGDKRVFTESVSWCNREICQDIVVTVFFEKSTVAVPVDEYNQMQAELERLRAERAKVNE